MQCAAERSSTELNSYFDLLAFFEVQTDNNVITCDTSLMIKLMRL